MEASPSATGSEEVARPGVVEDASPQRQTQSQPLAYSVALFDGAELRLELGADATVRDAYATAAAARGLPWYRVRLVAKGQQSTLTPSLERMGVATGGVRDLLLVVVNHVTLAEAEGSRPENLEDCTFEHHPATCFEGTGGHELEHFAGKRFTVRERRERVCDGVKFWSAPGDPMAEAAPLWGKVMIRVVLHQHSWALGVGVGTRELDTKADPEYQKSFFGLYHGASTCNVCAAGKRIYREGPEWPAEARLAVLVDIDGGTMQCFCGPEKYGPLFSSLPKDCLWPVIVAFRQSDSISLSVESTHLEAGALQ